MQLLLVNPQQTLPSDTAEWLGQCGWEITSVPDYESALSAARDQPMDAVIAAEPDPNTLLAGDRHNANQQSYDSLMRLLHAERTAVLMVAQDSKREEEAANSLVHFVTPNVSAAELHGRLATIERYHATVKQLERELTNLERIGKRLNEHFAEVDQEMRLASRLQCDFLPQLGSPINGVQFGAIYRPALWVSGDLYDVFRVDEEHVGFYIADAVGHGMAASLLTMFIKRTIVPKRIFDDRYEIVSPSEAIANLNDALTQQGLPNCQFVTAWYGLLNTRTLKLQYARGGHPHPMLFGYDSTMTEPKSPGSLLGLFAGEEFPLCEVQLHPGDKLLLYTDGVELAFDADEQGEPDLHAYRSLFAQLGSLSMPEIVTRIEARLDESSGSLNPRDDVTILGLQILPR